MKSIKIERHTIGDSEPTFVIAEIGSNHDGSLQRAKELIYASKESGADAVKFQSFTAEGLLNPYKPDNGKWTHHPAYEIIEKLALPDEWHFELKNYSDSLEITFLSAPFSEDRAVLLDKIGVSAFKVASGDLTNIPFLETLSHYGKPIILSTGASFLDEVAQTMQALTKEQNPELAILHCASLYPPKFKDANIRAMVTLADTFNVPVGYSDHTPGWTVPIAAVALGACIIEKHITISRDFKGPDHPYALEVTEFKTMVQEIRNLEDALGDGQKRPTDDEMGERVGARRSIYARSTIKRDSVITENMLKLVRHAHGLEPRDMELLIGRRASRDINEHDLVTMKDVEQ